MKTLSGTNLGRLLRDPKAYRVSPTCQVIVEEQPWSLSSSVGLFFGYGSRHEERRNLGLTHLAEHLFFKGTTRMSAEEISVAIERFGGEMNAYTDRELTCFYAYAPGDCTERALSLLFEMVFDARFDVEDFEKEKRVVVQELKSAEDSPEDVFWDRFFETIWKRDPLGRRIGGFAHEVETFAYKQLLHELEESFFRADFTIVVCGPVKAEKVVARVRELIRASREYVWGKVAFARPRRRPKRAAPAKFGEPYIRHSASHAHSGASQVQVAFAYPGVSASDAREISFTGAASLLGLGASSILYRELRENRALVYNVSFNSYSFSNTGIMAGYFTADPKRTREALAVCGEAVRSFATNLKPDDADFIHSSLKGALLLNFEGSYARMETLGRQHLLMGRIETLKQSLAELAKLRLEGLRKVGQILRRPPCFVVMGGKSRPSVATARRAWEGKSK